MATGNFTLTLTNTGSMPALTYTTFTNNYIHNTNQQHFKEIGFEPTSTGPRWRGKYKCIHCKSTGYIDDICMNLPHWWGRRHGNNCRKRFI